MLTHPYHKSFPRPKLLCYWAERTGHKRKRGRTVSTIAPTCTSFDFKYSRSEGEWVVNTNSHQSSYSVFGWGHNSQKQPKLGIFEGTNIGQFWLFLAPPANPVDFFWFQMAGKGVLHIVLMFYVGPAPLGGLLGPNSQLFSKIGIFCCFLAKKWGSFTRERLVEMNFFIK